MNQRNLLITKTHLYSFAKTYITVFVGIWLFGFEQRIDVFAAPFILDAAKVSLVSVVRNVYKLITEEPQTVNTSVEGK